jgi:DNA-binding MarR family transcriptional regulator
MEAMNDKANGDSRLREPSLTAWMRLARVYHKVDRASAEHLSAYGLSVGQFDVLVQVGAHEGITQNELAQKLLVTKSNVCQILGRMQQRGFIRREQEGRAKHLSLTEEGRRLYGEVVHSQESLIESLFSSLAEEDQDELSKTLGRLERSLR